MEIVPVILVGLYVFVSVFKVFTDAATIRRSTEERNEALILIRKHSLEIELLEQRKAEFEEEKRRQQFDDAGIEARPGKIMEAWLELLNKIAHWGSEENDGPRQRGLVAY